MNTKRYYWGILAVCAMMAVRMSSTGGQLVISGFSQEGALSWQYETNGIDQYRVEWKTNTTIMTSTWSELHEGFLPTGTMMNVQVPISSKGRFYRLHTAAWPVATNPPPAGMSLVPPGDFEMGSTDEGFENEQPPHRIGTQAFYIDTHEVAFVLWQQVRDWGITNGYTDISDGSAKANNHPVQTVSWYDCVKWCNARSEMEGRTPVYRTDGSQTNVYRTDQLDLEEDAVKWSANGYRLPTEAEWERAARGGLATNRFPWGPTISHVQANYQSQDHSYYPYDVNPTTGYHPDYYPDNGAPYTCPVGDFLISSNGYGLTEMSGNVWEWCWDWLGYNYYANSPSVDPVGPPLGSNGRVYRGGSFEDGAQNCRVSYRGAAPPDASGDVLGFRTVITAAPENP